MKKTIAAILAASMTIVSAFAIELSAGGTINFTPTFGVFKADIPVIGEQKKTNSHFMMGFMGFFDAQYAVVRFGVDQTIGKYKSKVKDTTTELDLKVTYFNIGIMGKYPFAVGRAKLYPLIGFDFDIPVSAKLKGEKLDSDYVKDNLHRYWFDLGFGADIFVTENLYIRPQAEFGVQMNKSKLDKDALDIAKKTDDKASFNHFKVEIGIGIGYQFMQ